MIKSAVQNHLLLFVLGLNALRKFVLYYLCYATDLSARFVGL